MDSVVCSIDSDGNVVADVSVFLLSLQECAIRMMITKVNVPQVEPYRDRAEEMQHALDTLSELPGIIRIRTFTKE